MNARVNLETPRLVTPFYLENVFSETECELIIRAGLASRGPSWWNGVNDPLSRSAWSSTLEPTRQTNWIHDRLNSACLAANKRYGFKVDALDPSLLFARYSTNDHFDWHLDLGENEISNRKVSIAVLLNDHEQFEGGNWEFVYTEPKQASMRAGTAAIFPAYLPHRVTPVTHGVRFSIVAWLCGPAFI